TTMYREAIDSFYENRNFDYEYGVKTLKQLFNRQGFSKAYLFKNTGRDMMAYSFPKNTGVELGKVNNDLTINLLENLNIKDGIRVNNSDKGFQVSKIIKNSKETESAYKDEKIKILGGDYKKGDVLYKTSDVKLLSNLKSTYKDVYGKKFDINIDCSFKIGEQFKLSCSYRNMDFSVSGEIVDKALKKPISKENLILNLKKTGNTPYVIKEVNFADYEEGFLPISKINEARRELIDKIEKSLLNVNSNKEDKTLNFNREQKKDGKFEKLIVSVQNMEQLKSALQCDVHNIMIDFSMRKCDIKIEDTRDFNLYVKVPSIVKGEYKSVEEFIRENIENIKGIVTCNTGIINEFKGKIQIIADYKLNLFNRYSLDFYKDDIDAAYLSVELKRSDILKTAQNSPIPLGVVVYGKLEAMICEYCPVGSTFGKRSTNSACSENCASNEYNLRDRLGERFLVRTDKYCRSHIYNSKALNLISNIKDNCLSNLSHRIDFVDESSEEVIQIITAYKEGKCNIDKEFTRGHYKRGVE
ncbi:MAG: DUF3656 domain-containing protein, partial [Clostridium sp.]|nr:DUF3656 domain-containing protein [Clostridium sp.]